MSMDCVGNSIHSSSISKRIAATDEYYLTFLDYWLKQIRAL